MIISFKKIYTNVYSVLSIDISVADESSVLFWHESFQLWES